MNFKISNWFWTQYLVAGVFISIFLLMILTPWYYSYGVSNISTVPVTPYGYDTNGNPINENGQRIDDYGNLVDENGELIDVYVGEKKLKSVQELIAEATDTSSEAETSFQRTYLNEGKFTFIDILILLSYLLSLSYVYGLFLSSVKNAICVNIPLILTFLIKTFGIFYYTKIYKLVTNNVLAWWLSLIIYFVVFYIHDRVVVTTVE